MVDCTGNMSLQQVVVGKGSRISLLGDTVEDGTQKDIIAMWLCCHNLVEAMTGTRHMPTKTLWDIGATTVEMNAKKRVLCGQREMFMHHNPVVPTTRNLAQQMPAVLIRSPRLTQMKHIQTMTEKSVNKKSLSRQEVRRGYHNPFHPEQKLLLQLSDDSISHLLTRKQHTTEDRSHAWSAGNSRRGHTAYIKTWINLTGSLYYHALAFYHIQ